MSIQPIQSVKMWEVEVSSRRERGLVTKALRCIKTRSTTPAKSTRQRQPEPPIKTREKQTLQKEHW